MLKFFAGAIAIIFWSIACLLAGSYFFAETQYIEAEQQGIPETVWKEKAKPVETKDAIDLEYYNWLVDINNSPLYFVSYTQDDTLYVTASDNNKSAQAKFKIKAVDKRKHILQLGIIYQYNIGYSGKVAYLYNLDWFAIGVGVIGNERNPGIEILIQKSFSL